MRTNRRRFANDCTELEAKIGSAPELLELADAVAAAVEHGKALRYAILGYAEVVGGAHEPVHQLALAHIARLEAIAEMVQRLRGVE